MANASETAFGVAGGGARPLRHVDDEERRAQAARHACASGRSRRAGCSWRRACRSPSSAGYRHGCRSSAVADERRRPAAADVDLRLARTGAGTFAAPHPKSETITRPVTATSAAMTQVRRLSIQAIGWRSSSFDRPGRRGLLRTAVASVSSQAAGRRNTLASAPLVAQGAPACLGSHGQPRQAEIADQRTHSLGPISAWTTRSAYASSSVGSRLRITRSAPLCLASTGKPLAGRDRQRGADRRGRDRRPSAASCARSIAPWASPGRTRWSPP